MAQKLPTSTIRRIRQLRYADGLTAPQAAAIVGCSQEAVRHYAPGRPGKVDNAKLRAAFEASGLGAQEVARRVGWWIHKSNCSDQPDGGRVRRTLGIALDANGNGRPSRRRYIDAETAAILAEAIGVAPWEVIPDEDPWSVAA
jgi:transcriptional regulator with XRE-family HTH domain